MFDLAGTSSPAIQKLSSLVDNAVMPLVGHNESGPLRCCGVEYSKVKLISGFKNNRESYVSLGLLSGLWNDRDLELQIATLVSFASKLHSSKAPTEFDDARRRSGHSIGKYAVVSPNLQAISRTSVFVKEANEFYKSMGLFSAARVAALLPRICDGVDKAMSGKSVDAVQGAGLGAVESATCRNVHAMVGSKPDQAGVMVEVVATLKVLREKAGSGAITRSELAFSGLLLWGLNESDGPLADCSDILDECIALSALWDSPEVVPIDMMERGGLVSRTVLDQIYNQDGSVAEASAFGRFVSVHPVCVNGEATEGLYWCLGWEAMLLQIKSSRVQGNLFDSWSDATFLCYGYIMVPQQARRGLGRNVEGLNIFGLRRLCDESGESLYPFAGVKRD